MTILNPEAVKDLIIKLDAQHPRTWTQGHAYPAINPVNGEELLIKRSRSVGTRLPFLHIYQKCTRVVKTPTGEILSREPSQNHYRADLTKYTLEQI